MTGETETNGFAFLFCKKKCAGWQEPAGSRGAAGELGKGGEGIIPLDSAGA